MEYTKGKWYVSLNGKILVKEGGEYKYIADMPFASAREADEMPEANNNANLISAAPDMYEALKSVSYLISVARQYFPKSVKNSDKFELENICACVNKALAKAEGKK